MRRPTTLGHGASGSYAAKTVSPAKDDKVVTMTTATNRSPLVVRRNSSGISAKNSSPLMMSRKMSIQQSQGLKRNCGSSSIGNSILQRAASSCTTPIQGNNPLFKPCLHSKIIIGIAAVLLIAILIEILVLSTISSPNMKKEGASLPSFFLRKKKSSLQQFIQHPRSETSMQQILGTDNVLTEYENVDATTAMGQNEPITIQEYSPSNTETFCPKDGNIFASYDDDNGVNVKGPVIEMADLRQLSNRDSHFKDSKCPRNIQDTEIGTTLVTQATLDRLPFVKEICQRWSSPMIVVVCLSSSQVDGQDWKSVQERYDRLCPQLKMVPVTVDDMERDYKYPINRLRNRGLDEVETSHVLMIDVDFIPSENLDQAVLKAIQIHMEQEEEEQKDDRSSRRQYMSDKLSISSVIRSMLRFFQFGQEHRYHYRALVVPAFERKVKICQDVSLEECIQYTSKFEEFMPRSIQSLKQCMNSTNADKRQNGSDSDGASAPPVEVVNSSIESSKCIVFHSDYFPKGHGNTKSAQWLKESDQNSVRAIPCINTDAYEPYLALPWCPSTKLNHYTLESTVMDRLDRYDDNHQKQMPEPWTPLTPYYDERFYGYGKNKLQHIFQLQQIGYAFSVIPAIGFLTHHPHPDSNTKIHWKERSRRWVEDQENVKVKMKRLYKKFKCEMEQEYERLFPLPTESC
jgi:hypothetical protein